MVVDDERVFLSSGAIRDRQIVIDGENGIAVGPCRAIIRLFGGIDEEIGLYAASTTAVFLASPSSAKRCIQRLCHSFCESAISAICGLQRFSCGRFRARFSADGRGRAGRICWAMACWCAPSGAGRLGGVNGTDHRGLFPEIGCRRRSPVRVGKTDDAGWRKECPAGVGPAGRGCDQSGSMSATEMSSASKRLRQASMNFFSIGRTAPRPFRRLAKGAMQGISTFFRSVRFYNLTSAF